MFQGTKMQFKSVSIPLTKEEKAKEKKTKKKTVRKRKEINDTKTTSILAVKKLLPDADLTTGTERSKKPHDGICDAALLALFGQRKRY
jgi:hypothetical protein